MAATPVLISNTAPLRNSGNVLSYFNKMPKWLDSLNYTGAAAKSYTVPAGCSLIHIQADQNCYIQTNGGVAVAPAGDNVGGTSSTILFGASAGVWWSVNSGDVLSIFSTAAGNVYIEGWK